MSKLIAVFGGQFGSEGKGQVVAHITRQCAYGPITVRVGGPNAGHTVYPMGPERDPVKVQQIPVSAFVSHWSIPVIGAGAVILPDILLRELRMLRELWDAERPLTYIDEFATVITPEHMQAEQADLVGRISSTGEGVGAATADKVMRTGTTLSDWLLQNGSLQDEIMEEGGFTIVDTVAMLNKLRTEERAIVILEGTQGYLLSLNVGGYYPFCTSRDCGPEALMAQAGVNPRGFDDVEVMAVFRTYPIRVGGPSGPLPYEISWDEMRRRTGGYVAQPEITTVTGKTRRIAEWDRDAVRRVIDQTSPTSIALTFLDYVDPAVANKPPNVSMGARQFIGQVQNETGTRVSLVSTGPGVTWSLRTGEDGWLF